MSLMIATLLLVVVVPFAATQSTTLPDTPGDSAPNTPGDTAPNTPGDTAPSTPGDTASTNNPSTVPSIIFETQVRLAEVVLEFPFVDFVKRFGHAETAQSAMFLAHVYEMLTTGVRPVVSPSAVRELSISGSSSILVTVRVDTLEERDKIDVEADRGLCLVMDLRSYCTGGPYVALNGILPTLSPQNFTNTTAAPLGTKKDDGLKDSDLALMIIAGILALVALIAIVAELRKRRNTSKEASPARETYLPFAAIMKVQKDKPAGDYPSFNAHPPVADYSKSRANSTVGLLHDYQNQNKSATAKSKRSYDLISESAFHEDRLEDALVGYDLAAETQPDHTRVDIENQYSFASKAPSSSEKRQIPPPAYGSIRSVSVLSKSLPREPPSFAPPPPPSDAGSVEMPAPPPRRSLRKPHSPVSQKSGNFGLASKPITE